MESIEPEGNIMQRLKLYIHVHGTGYFYLKYS